jgi:hypothetical protein
MDQPLMLRLTGRLAPAWIGLASIGLALAGLMSLPARAAGPGERIADLRYDVYVGGLHIFTFDVEMTLLPDRYRLAARGETRGMVSWVYTWTQALAAEGHDQDGRIVPQLYVADSQWQSNRRTVRLDFNADGRYALEQEPPPEPDPDIEGTLPERLPEGIVDPLSFAFAASRAFEKSGSCDQTVPVFDGQRRFDVILKQVGPTTLPANNYSIYQGPAMRCSLGIKRISGFRKSLATVQQERDRSTPPSLWVASIRDGLPPLPVRYEGEIKLGKIVIHLTHAELRAGTGSAAVTD